MATRTSRVVELFKALQDLGDTVGGHKILVRYFQEKSIKTEKGSKFHSAFIRLEGRLVEFRVFGDKFIQVIPTPGKPLVLKLDAWDVNEVVSKGLAGAGL